MRHWSASTSRSPGRAGSRPGTCCRSPVPARRSTCSPRTWRRPGGELDVPLALEPIAALFDWPDDEFDEAEFLHRLHDRTGAPLLLDVANTYVNARNRGRDPRADVDALLAGLPPGAVAYCHVAGHAADATGLLHDTHTDPVPDAVLALLTHTVAQLPVPPPVMLERDGRYPPAAELRAELDAVAAAAGHAAPCRTGADSGHGAGPVTAPAPDGTGTT